jgi:hypothetical protein
MDWSNPDYKGILAKRLVVLEALKADPQKLAAVRQHYTSHPADFINDWGMTYDPRRLERGLQANVPFILWPRQKEYIEWVYGQWRSSERGLVEKTRDCGATWLSSALAATLWLFHDGIAIGFGSRKESLVDKLGDPDCIFEKIRHFVRHVPQVFMPEGFDEQKHATFMRLVNPETSASITGEAGDNIGRGGRKSIFFVDESAFLEHQAVVDKALSQTTNCQIDISTFNGAGNEFYNKWQRFKGTSRHFVFDWRQDPRKDDAWYQRQVAEQTEQTVAQEIDRDPLASATDSFIPAKWLKATVDAHIKLQFRPTGIKASGFDPADTGDAKGFVFRHGSVITVADQMNKGDITAALPWAFDMAESHRASVFAFDADGLGAPVIKTYLMSATAGDMQIAEYRGSGAIEDKKKSYTKGGIARKNEDVFLNYRSQSWTWFRERCEKTYNAIQSQAKGQLVNADPEDLISISSECKEYNNLIAELSQPRRIWTNNGKIAVESKKAMKARGVTSPNLADAAIVAMSVRKVKTNHREDILNRYVPHTVADRAMGY